MGKVKAWMMGMEEDIQGRFLDGEIDARQSSTELAKVKLMDPDEIEEWIDDNTAERARNIANASMQKITE